MPKSDRNGQAEIWTADQLEAVMAELAPNMRALFSICRYTGCRISEARQLRAEDLVNDVVVFRKRTTKGEAETREVAMHPKLRTVLREASLPVAGYLFAGRKGQPITRQAADKALRLACDRLGFTGFSTHSFRRTALTRLSDAGVPLRVVQEISGHRSLDVLRRYLEVKPEQIEDAISML
ncbi:MAG: site-specific integrase [Leptolyngbya sp. SIO4C1]|nr:site-specific integrase [Leptolyngbya sp. SIO4C1]